MVRARYTGKNEYNDNDDGWHLTHKLLCPSGLCILFDERMRRTHSGAKKGD